MVANTSELLPEPETPVNTVSRRFGSSTLTSLRLFTRAPCTRIRSWRSATRSAGDCASVLVAMLIVFPYAKRARLRDLRRRRLARPDHRPPRHWPPRHRCRRFDVHLVVLESQAGPLRPRRPVASQSSARRFLHERADPCFAGGGQLRQSEADR